MASTEHPKDYGIGMRIAEYRRALGWSQHQLAKRLKTNSHTVENWEQAAAIPSVESELCVYVKFFTSRLMRFSGRRN